MIEIKHDMLNNLNFYGIYGFLQAAANHRDYCTQDEGAEIFKLIQTTIHIWEKEHPSVESKIRSTVDRSTMLNWVSDMMSRGMILCATI